MIFLALAVAVLAYKANRRHGYRPFFMGLTAATMIVVGKYAFDNDLFSYAGTFLLVAASVWNAWSGRTNPPDAGSPADSLP